MTAETKSAPSPAFKPGDRVVLREDSPADRCVKDHVWKILRTEGQRAYMHSDSFAAMNPRDCRSREMWSPFSSLKPAPVEMWGSQPNDDELPATLPAGTKSVDGFDMSGWKLRTGRLPNKNAAGYYAHWYDSGGDTWSPTQEVAWTTVPRPSPKPVPAQAGNQCKSSRQEGQASEPSEPGQSPPDPYAGYDLNAWGIPSKRRPASTPYGPACLECGQETTRVNHAGEPSCVDCQCMVADAILGKGQANEPIDRRIASARQSTEREAGVKRFDAWVSTRHARKP